MVEVAFFLKHDIFPKFLTEDGKVVHSFEAKNFPNFSFRKILPKKAQPLTPRRDYLLKISLVFNPLQSIEISTPRFPQLFLLLSDEKIITNPPTVFSIFGSKWLGAMPASGISESGFYLSDCAAFVRNA